MKIWRRLSMANGITIIASLLFFGMLLNKVTGSNLKRELDRRMKAEALLVARQVDEFIQGFEYCADSLVVITNDNVSRIDQSRPITVAERVTLQNQISFALSIFPNISTGWIVLSNSEAAGFGRFTSAENRVKRAAAGFVSDESPMGPSTLNITPEDQIEGSVLLLLKRLIHINTGKPMGTIVLTADRESFANVLARTDTDFPASYSIVDSAGRSVVDPVRIDSQIDNRSEYDAALVSVDWRVLSRISRREITDQLRRNSLILSVLLGIAALTASTAGILISRSITLPLSRLEARMNELDLEKGTGTIAAEGAWEIRQVAQGANKLIGRVHALVDRVAEEERERQRYRFELLQAQIKPHFLYNALEMIHVLGETGRRYKAQRAIRVLSEFYRFSLSSGKDFISLRDELKLTEHYLFIQHMRYHDQFSYRMESIGPGDAADRIRIPKLTVQPFVENAIYHGIKGLSRVCTITVRAETAEGSEDWRLVVADTGRGMTQDKLDELESLHHGDSVGVPNVLQRLSLYMKDTVNFSVDSRPGGGTRIVIQTKGFEGSRMNEF